MPASRIAPALVATLLASAAPALAQDADAPVGPPSANVTILDIADNAESCVYDADRGLILALNRAAAPKDALNDAFISLIDHDGTVQTDKWTGDVAGGPVLNQPYGSAIAGGLLYVADRNGGTSKSDPARAVLRVFDLATGALKSETAVDSPGLNDIAVAADGMVYATQTSLGGGKSEAPDPDSWKVFAITSTGEVSVLIQGPPLNQPNGIEMDGAGNIVVVNLGDAGVLTFSREGELLTSQAAAQPGSDGIVILPDGTLYVNSLREGGLSRIAPGQPAELIATGIAGGASMCLDTGANQLVIPLGSNNGLAFVPLE